MMAWRVGGLAIGTIIGIVVAAQDTAFSLLLMWALVALGAGATVAGFIAERHWQPWPKSVLGLAAILCAFPLGYFRTVDVIGPPTPGSFRAIIAEVEPFTPMTVRGVVASEPEIRGTGELDVYLRVHEVRFGEAEDAEWVPVQRGQLLIRVFARASNPPEIHSRFNQLASTAAYGWKLEVNGTYRPIDAPLNPDTFDYATFLIQSGVDTRIRSHVSDVTVVEQSRGHPMMELALLAKNSFFETYKERVRAPASRLTAAATLGARRSVENIDYRGQDLATTLRHAGVGHVLAVSGLHVSVIAVMLFALFRLTGAKPRSFVPILILFLILFAMLTGARPSSVRAVIMNSVVLIAIAYLRSNFRTATVIGLSLSSFFILMRNPTVLFAPSFLLSYGAVLSLIIIAPPLDRLICLLRGFSLLFAAVWFALLLRLAGWHLDWLVQPSNLIAYVGALWLAIMVGTRLNHHFPAMWALSVERIPSLVRLFFAAQLAIQFGMMIPMSSWFFGQFPVAGVLVNLLAIPAVGVLVQLGMLTGLIGMIPVIGPWLSIPFGAATSLTGDAFILLAYTGSWVFPYPATPLPTITWMIVYYVSLTGFLFIEGYRTRVVGLLYRWIPPSPTSWLRRSAWVVPVALVLMPWWPALERQPNLRDIRILAEGRFPIVTMTGSDRAFIINAGGPFAGGRLVFDSVRGQGATQLDAVLLPSPDPRAGIAGAAELVERMRVGEILMPFVPAEGQTLPEAIGDGYLIRQAARGVSWAANYERSFERLRQAANEHGVPLRKLEDEALPQWGNATFRLLPQLEELPGRFASSAMTPVIHATIHGLDWVIITDTTPDAIFKALSETTSSDILVVPNLIQFSSYGNWLRTALRRLSPRVLIIASDSAIDPERLAPWLPDDPDRVLIETAREGAVLIRLRGADETRLETYRGGQQWVLTPQQ